MARSNETKIVLLGKTGVGKSSLGNTILGDSLFKGLLSPESVTNKCNAESKYINGERVTVIDTPGFFDNTLEEEKLKAEMIKCIEHCSAGIHAFLIVLKVDRYTDQEKEIIKMIKQYFSEESLKHAVVVFTHGDQLEEGQTIDEFVGKSKDLKELVDKCGGRCHVVDNKYWKNQQDGYRSNRFQVKQLLKTIENMKQNKGVYTNEFLQLVVGHILKISVGITVGALLGMLLGATVLVPYVSLDIAKAIGAVAGGAVGVPLVYSSRTINEGVQVTAKIIVKKGGNMIKIICANNFFQAEDLKKLC